MSTNIQKLADRLKQFGEDEQNSQKSRLIWKPNEGIQTIRLVPYKHQLDNPFIELKFYYNIGKNYYLAPCTFGKPDPILEVIDTLRSSGSNEEKEIATKLKPTDRTYAPIIVRGEEDKGVRFWGFGITVYKTLLKLMTTPGWGDITSLTDGNDIQVEFHKVSKKKNAKGQSFPETIITPLPLKGTAVDPERRDLMEKIRDQANILDVFPLKSYDELKAAVETWLHPDPNDPLADNAQVGESSNTPAGTQAASVTASPKGNTAEEWKTFFDTK